MISADTKKIMNGTLATVVYNAIKIVDLFNLENHSQTKAFTMLN